MYGTVARLRIKPENVQEFLDYVKDIREETQDDIPVVFEHIYQLDKGDNEYMLVVGFESREAYKANAESPEMHERYQEYRKLLESDPEWNDGEVIFNHGL